MVIENLYCAPQKANRASVDQTYRWLEHVVACRLPEISTLLTYLILDRKRLVSGSDFPYLSVCRRSFVPCSGRDDVEAEALVLRLVADYGS